MCNPTLVFIFYPSVELNKNLLSFTINLENELSFVWDKVLTDHYGEPLERAGDGKPWTHKNYAIGQTVVANITREMAYSKEGKADKDTDTVKWSRS